MTIGSISMFAFTSPLRSVLPCSKRFPLFSQGGCFSSNGFLYVHQWVLSGSVRHLMIKCCLPENNRPGRIYHLFQTFSSLHPSFLLLVVIYLPFIKTNNEANLLPSSTFSFIFITRTIQRIKIWRQIVDFAATWKNQIGMDNYSLLYQGCECLRIWL